MALLVSMRSASSNTCGRRLHEARSPSSKPSGISAINPPTLVRLVVRRAPVQASWRSYIRSRSWKVHKNGVNAPRSTAVVPSQTRCEMTRLISHAITRSTLHRSVSSIPINFSAPIARQTLFAMGAR